MDERQFRHLLSKYVQGKSTPEEIKLLHRFYDSFQEEASEEPDAFDQWLEEKRIHLNIKQNIERKDRQQYEAQRQRVSRSRAALKIAASVLLGISLGIASYVAYQNIPVPEQAWKENSTRKGQKATIMLTDGTKIYLNADSKLSFPEHFDSEKREVLLEGEAFFEVVRNPTRPFIITSGKLTTTVLGTSFNIKAFANEPLAVTVATGQVKVNALHDNGTSQEVRLRPYQQAYYDGVLSKQDVDTSPFLAWREKVIRFDQATLAEAAVVLERWFDVSIDIENESLRTCRISGKYINENLTNVLESFAHIMDITYRLEGDHKVILAGKGCNPN